jgi:hypothetical protein
MEDLRITYDSVFTYIIVFNTILGLLFGFFPLLVGLRLQNRKYAFLGFVVSIATGAVTGVLLAFPISLLFVWLILRSVPSGTQPEPAEVAATDSETEFTS